ncbi:unnamed protein product [Gongylonema pulchrum]|uniref:Uncharacterized protein n=1 Tax=Gongylonema pulchrum TaxID=637853 RepID=A0A3P6RYK0_9BILA|nr:unnamed protein product [Gongylonema pulchrum]
MPMVTLITHFGKKASGTLIRVEWKCRMLCITAKRALNPISQYHSIGNSTRKPRKIQSF